MKTIALSLFCLLPFAFCPLQNPQRSELDHLLRRVESHYAHMRGLAADFEQVYRAPGIHERRESGRLFLGRPRRMRWEYDPKPGKLFIVNGRDVWFYVPADREAIHAETNAVSDARFPFLFLLSQMSLRREFRSIELLDLNPTQPDLRVLRLIPRERSSSLREIFLELSSDGRISKVRMIDEAGASSELSLMNVRENFIAPTGAFEFHPPPGVRVRQK